MTVAQCRLDHRPRSIRIAKHLIVPEADNAISFALDHARSSRIGCFAVLAAVDFDDELGSVAGEIGDEMPDRNLASKVMISEALSENPPKRALGIGNFSSEATRATDGAVR